VTAVSLDFPGRRSGPPGPVVVDRERARPARVAAGCRSSAA